MSSKWKRCREQEHFLCVVIKSFTCLFFIIVFKSAFLSTDIRLASVLLHNLHAYYQQCSTAKSQGHSRMTLYSDLEMFPLVLAMNSLNSQMIQFISMAFIQNNPLCILQKSQWYLKTTQDEGQKTNLLHKAKTIIISFFMVVLQRQLQ